MLFRSGKVDYQALARMIDYVIEGGVDYIVALGDVIYTTVRLEDFLADIKEQALGLAEIYHQKIDWKAGQSDKKVTIAYDPMFRAVMNVIQNAMEHTKENGIIYIGAKEHDGRLTFIVEDSGSGFTKEALLHGTEQFFMDDTSRNGYRIGRQRGHHPQVVPVLLVRKIVGPALGFQQIGRAHV